jgi:hypothetical protein
MNHTAPSSDLSARTPPAALDRLHLAAAYAALGVIALVSFGTLVFHLG